MRGNDGIREKKTQIARGAASFFAALLLAFEFFAPVKAEVSQPAPVTVAITEFSFRDTSDEPKDQKQIHEARRHHFMAALAADLEKSGRYRVIALTCGTEPCAATPVAAAELLTDARKAGADLLMIGGIQKMSTLVLWMKTGLFDVQHDQSVFDRLFTFRGDNDEAWAQAEGFIVRQLNELKLSELRSAK